MTGIARGALLDALVEAIDGSPDEARRDLRRALDDYLLAYPRTRRRAPRLLTDLLDAIEEGTEEPI